jgi:tRNA dimethylallyltransferase
LTEARLISVFGPTGAGKTAVAIELARLLRRRGHDPVAVNCDSIQVYRGLEVLSGAADALGQSELEHRLLSFVPVDEEFSAGRYATLARSEIDRLLAEDRFPILVGGTGLYLRGALSEIEFPPPVPEEIRREVERELQERGAAALHSELPEDRRSSIHPNDRQRVARSTELLRSGTRPAPDHRGGGELWTAHLRHPSALIGLALERKELLERIAVRVEAMAVAGAGEEAARAVRDGASRTARAAIGFQEFLDGDLERASVRHRQFARRQMTWMRRMHGVNVIERCGRSDRDLAAEALSLSRLNGPGDASSAASG